MAKTLANVQTETRIYLDESSAIDFLDSEVTIAINRGYHDVVGHVMSVWEEFYSTTSPFTYAIVANQQEYTIDSSLIKVSRVEINYQPTSTGTIAVRALPIKKDEVRGNLANTNNQSGSFFSASYYLHGQIGSQKIGFIPVPTVGDTTGQSISVWGIQLPGDLVNTGDNVTIPYVDRFVYLISLHAAAQLLRKGQQEDRSASNYMQEYTQGIIEMKDFLKDRQGDDMQIITDSILETLDMSTIPIV